MKKKDKERLDNLIDNIEDFFAGLSSKDKWNAGVDICMFTAYASTDDPKEEDGISGFFSHIDVLDTAKKELTELVDRELLDAIGNEVVEYARTHENESETPK